MKRFRELCYKELEERFQVSFAMREEIAWLIRYHGLPLLFMEKGRPAYDLVRARESVRLELLYLLGKADVLGRECSDRDAALDTVGYFKSYAEETGCYEKRIRFANHIPGPAILRNGFCGQERACMTRPDLMFT